MTARSATLHLCPAGRRREPLRWSGFRADGPAEIGEFFLRARMPAWDAPRSVTVWRRTFSGCASAKFSGDNRGRARFKSRAKKFFIFNVYQVLGGLRDARDSAYFDCAVSDQLRLQRFSKKLSERFMASLYTFGGGKERSSGCPEVCAEIV